MKDSMTYKDYLRYKKLFIMFIGLVVVLTAFGQSVRVLQNFL